MPRRRPDLDAILLALGHPTRRGIIQELMRAPLSEADLVRRFDVSANTINKHVRILLRAGMVSRSGREQPAPRPLYFDHTPLDPEASPHMTPSARRIRSWLERTWS